MKFDKVFCISLARRPERYEKFIANLPSDFPFADKLEKFTAIDGQLTHVPAWWKQGRGAWGCYRSHLQILETCLNNPEIKSVLFMEDDAIFVPDFAERWNNEIKKLPPNVDMLYLGGQLIRQNLNPPIKFNDKWLRPFNVNRTHAYAICNRPAMMKIYQHLCATKTWQDKHHIDHHYGKLLEQKQVVAVAPISWYAMQGENKSDINGRQFPDRMWNLQHSKLKELNEVAKFNNELVIVLGLHRSGSSLIANICNKLGVNFPKPYVGCEENGGSESRFIANLCERAMPFPKTQIRMNANEFIREFQGFIERNKNGGKLLGIKYPHLCVFAQWLYNEYANTLPIKIIHCVRPVEKSIASLIRRDGAKRDHMNLQKVQTFLETSKNEFLNNYSYPEHVLHVDYEKLIDNPRHVIGNIAEHLQLDLHSPKFEAAVNLIKPEKQHIK